MMQNMLTIDDPHLIQCIMEIGDNGIMSDETTDETHNTELEENANNSEE